MEKNCNDSKLFGHLKMRTGPILFSGIPPPLTTQWRYDVKQRLFQNNCPEKCLKSFASKGGNIISRRNWNDLGASQKLHTLTPRIQHQHWLQSANLHLQRQEPVAWATASDNAAKMPSYWAWLFCIMNILFFLSR